MSASEDKGKKFSHSSWSLLCCRNGISSTTTSAAEREKNSEELSRNSSRSSSNKKPGGWKAMPFILGLILFSFPSFHNHVIILSQKKGDQY